MVSCAAQLLTWPVVLYHFHRYAVYGVFMSPVVMVLTMVLVYGVVAVGCIGLVSTSVAGIMTPALEWTAEAQQSVLTWQCSLPGAVVEEHWGRKAEPQWLFYNNGVFPCLHVIGSRESWLVCPLATGGMTMEEVESRLHAIPRTFWQRRLWERPTLLPPCRSVRVGETRVCVLSGPSIMEYTPEVWSSATEEDAVWWLCRGIQGSLSAIPEDSRPRMVVLDASLSRRQRDRYRRECAALGVPCHDVAEQGALAVSLKARGYQ